MSTESSQMLDLTPPTVVITNNKDHMTEEAVNSVTLSSLPVKDLELRSNAPTVTTEEASLISSVSDLDLFDFSYRVRWWDGKKKYSDLIRDGLRYKKSAAVDSTVMLFESPSSSSTETSFYNCGPYRMHDWPPPKSNKAKGVLGPCRYALMSGDTYPVYLREQVPEGLVEHWKEVIPDFKEPTFVPQITENETAYAYLPVEQIKNHVNCPNVHFHLVGKDAIHLMTQKTTKLLPNTKDVRPCVVKTTHSMGSKGIFVIKNDEDEAEFHQFLQDSGNPTYVITDFIDIQRNIACHFFIHPNGDVTWLGSNENKRLPDGRFSSDSYLITDEQEQMKQMQLPYVEDVANYCQSLGFWGFCGVDVLFDQHGQGFLVDVNPRVTGSCPALMTLCKLREAHGYKNALFRRSGDINFYGTPSELFEQVKEYNTANAGEEIVVIHSYYWDHEGDKCRINIGVYGHDLEKCKETVNHFAKPSI
jgi:hypothetical protein